MLRKAQDPTSALSLMKEKNPTQTLPNLYATTSFFFSFLLLFLTWWPYWSYFPSPFILEQFEYRPSWISCKTQWTTGQLAGWCLRCSETTLKAIFFGVWFNIPASNEELWNLHSSSLDFDKSKQEKTVISHTISKVKNKNKLLQVIVFQLFNYCGCQNKKK